MWKDKRSFCDGFAREGLWVAVGVVEVWGECQLVLRKNEAQMEEE